MNFLPIFFACIAIASARPSVDDEIPPGIPACFINVNNGLPEPQPLLLKPGSEELKNPSDRRGIIELEKGEQLEIFCASGFLSRPAKTNIILTCVSDTTFADESGQKHEFLSYACISYPPFSVVNTGRTCFDGAIVLDVGFYVGTRFVKIYDICFDAVLERTHYVTHHFTPAHAGFQSNFNRTGWSPAGCFDTRNVDTLYSRNTQRATIGNILGSSLMAAKYIPTTTDWYLARGHLGAKTDFIYGNEHRVTFIFANAAPQWQVFNGGNWQYIEDCIKTFVADRNIEVDAYTGTFGITTLKDASGMEREIYLAMDLNNNGVIPVPKFFYKVLVDRATHNGLVLIGVNNPYLTLEEIQKDYIICEDIGDQIDWIYWKRTDIFRGYSYACEVNDFFKIVKHHPHVTVKGLLI